MATKWFKDLSNDIIKRNKAEAKMQETFSNVGDASKASAAAVKQEMVQTIQEPIGDDHPDNTQVNLDTIVIEDNNNFDVEQVWVLYEKLLHWLYSLVRIHWHKWRMAWEFAYFRKWYIQPISEGNDAGIILGKLWEWTLFNSMKETTNDWGKAIIEFLDSEII